MTRWAQVTEHYEIQSTKATPFFPVEWNVIMSDGQRTVRIVKTQAEAEKVAHEMEAKHAETLAKFQASEAAQDAKREAEAQAKAEAERVEAVAQEMDKMTAPKATAKQVAFMLKLIADDRHEGSYFTIPTDYDALSNLDRKTASRYIDAMLNN